MNPKFAVTRSTKLTMGTTLKKANRVVVEKRTATNAVETHYAETTASGGYSVRVLGGAGAYRVEFSHPDFVTQTANVILTSEQVDIGGGRTWTRVFNEKVDLIMGPKCYRSYGDD